MHKEIIEEVIEIGKNDDRFNKNRNKNRKLGLAMGDIAEVISVELIVGRRGKGKENKSLEFGCLGRW